MRRAAPLLLGLTLALAAAGRDAADRWVMATDLPALVPATSVEMRGADGTLLRAFTVDDGRWRLAVTPEAVDPGYLAQLVAFEDKRFHSHGGVDALALLRAAGQAAWNGRVVSGGSTLTMQVARLLEESGTGQWTGKLRQMRLALALERQLSKREILTLYLTLAPFGGNLEGVRAATLAYFGKEPRRLTPAEAALLVALPQAPEARRPDRHERAAQAARDRVLARMARDGVLPAEDARLAAAAPIPDGRRLFPALSPHVTERLLARDPTRQRHDLTLEPGLQAQLERLAAMAIAARGARLSVAILVADHRSGAVLASVGSGGYRADARQGFVDMTRALRSPGSTLKPLVYGMAFDDGLAHPETLIDDRPKDFGGYAPQNFDGLFRGEIRVREALQLSLNLPVVSLTESVGPARLVAAMRRAGMSPRVQGRPGLAVALGGVGVTLEDLVTLYGGLARGGVPMTLGYRSDDGAAARDGRHFLSRSAAWQVGHILAGIPAPAGAMRAPLAYKTGTSYGHRDAWAVGFDGEHVIGVWMGRADGTPVPGAFGGDLAAPILFEAFARLKPAPVPLPPPPPETLLSGTAALPAPLRRFRGRGAVLSADADAPQVAFPPDGATLALEGPLPLKVRDGTPPFTWLIDGIPAGPATRDRQARMPATLPGFVTLSVIDARGRAARARVRLE